MRILLLLLITCTACMASPFLVMSPSPYTGTSSNIAGFNLFFDGSSTSVGTGVVLDAAGNQNMHFDLALANLTAASHTVVATAVNANGVSSALSAPFTFSLVAPAAPSGLSVQPK